MRRSIFKIEALGTTTYQGHTRDEDWNGWDCPYFTYCEAENIVKDYNTLKKIVGDLNLAYYDSVSDLFVFPVDDNEVESFPSETIDGIKFYPIGAFSWIWQQVEI